MLVHTLTYSNPCRPFIRTRQNNEDTIVAWQRVCAVFLFHHIRKTPFLSVHTKTISRRFQKSPLSGAFLMTVFTGNVWTVGQTGGKNLRFQTTDTCGRGLSFLANHYTTDLRFRFNACCCHVCVTNCLDFFNALEARIGKKLKKQDQNLQQYAT